MLSKDRIYRYVLLENFSTRHHLRPFRLVNPLLKGNFKSGRPRDFLSFICEESANSLPAQLNSKNTAVKAAPSSRCSQRALRAV